MCKILFVAFKTGVSFLQSSESPIIKSLWPSRSDSLGIPSPFLNPQAWKTRIQNLQNSARTFVLLFSSLWVTHPVVMGFDFIMVVLLLPTHCCFFFVFGPGMSLMVSHVVLLMVVQQLIGILVLSEEMSAHPSTPPS